MSPWALFVLAVVAIFLGSIFRGPRNRQPPFGRGPDEANSNPPRRNVPVPVGRRRMPPPLPVARAVERARPVVQVAQVVPAPSVVAPVIVVPAEVESKPLSAAGIQVVALLKHKQTLRTAILLREVLDPPVSRRRRLR
jgi:hypothetical protein